MLDPAGGLPACRLARHATGPSSADPLAASSAALRGWVDGRPTRHGAATAGGEARPNRATECRRAPSARGRGSGRGEPGLRHPTHALLRRPRRAGAVAKALQTGRGRPGRRGLGHRRDLGHRAAGRRRARRLPRSPRRPRHGRGGLRSRARVSPSGLRPLGARGATDAGRAGARCARGPRHDRPRQRRLAQPRRTVRLRRSRRAVGRRRRHGDHLRGRRERTVRGSLPRTRVGPAHPAKTDRSTRRPERARRQRQARPRGHRPRPDRYRRYRPQFRRAYAESGAPALAPQSVSAHAPGGTRTVGEAAAWERRGGTCG